MDWSQLRTVIWLRWRLSRNQIARLGTLNAVVAVIGLIGGICLAVGMGVAGIFIGASVFSKAEPRVIMVAWDGLIALFLFFWMIGVLTEIQRSETIDLARLLHLPVTLQGVFVINYIASHVSFGLIIFVPITVGLCLGLIWSKGLMMIFLLPLILTFIFMVTAWTYCLRGWLITLMVNPRRRRNIILVLTLSIVLLGQAPNLYFNVYLRHGRGIQRAAARHSGQQGFAEAIPQGWITAHDYVPVLWVPGGALALVQGNAVPAMLGSLGALLLGAAGLARAYRSTMKFYLGQEKGKAVPARVEIAGGETQRAIRKNFIEKRVPYVSEEVAALSLAFFRSMTRAPEVRIALFTNALVVIVVFGALFSNVLKGKTGMFQLFSVTGAVGFTFFGLVQLMFNHFGYDREGFRSLVLSPTARKDVLLAKNLALAPFVFVLGLLLLAGLAGVMHVPLLGVLAGTLQLITMFLLLSMVGNFFSSWMPFRVSGGSLKPTKPPIKVVFTLMLCQFLFPLAMLPVIAPPLLGMLLEKLDFWPAPWTDAILSFGLLALVAFFYKMSLNGLGNFLEKREQKILLVVSQELE